MRYDVMYSTKRLIDSMKMNNDEMDLRFNVSKLARDYDCDWRTAKKYLSGNYEKRERKPRPSKLDYFKDFIKQKYEQGATAKSIYEYLIKYGYNGRLYEGKYTILREFCKELKLNETKKAVVRYETLPGEQAQVDWKERFKLHSKHGQLFEFNIFLYSLSFSRKKYICITLDREQKTLFNSLISAFKYTGGVPKKILFDNMRTVVDRARSEFRKVVLNEKFRQFSLDMGFEPNLCRAYRPQSKGKIESVAKLIDRLKVYNNEFDTLEDIYRIVEQFNIDINNEISQATNQTPNELVKIEKEYLSPINDIIAQNYVSKSIMKRIVNRESMIEYKGCKYSVPTNLIGKTVEIKVEENQLYIYYTNLFITKHQIKDQKFNYLKDHLIDILQHDAFKKYDNGDIEQIAEDNLAKLDQIYKLRRNNDE